MKIAWGRITQGIDLRPSKTTAGFSEERFAFFSEMVRRGHTIKIVTSMTKDSENLRDNVISGKIKTESGLDVTWLKSVEYAPAELCDGTETVLVFESGPPNCMFGSSHIKGLPLLRCAQIIGSFKKGPVFLSQNDPDLPFPLLKFTVSKVSWSHPDNVYRLCTKNNTYADGKYDFKHAVAKGVKIEEHGWSDYENFFTKDKRVVLMSKSINTEKVAKEYDGSRCGYARLVKKKLLTVESMPTVYSMDYVSGLGFNYEPKYDVIYTGYPRNREKSFVELFVNDSKKLKMAVTGPWKGKDFDLINSENTVHLGKISGFINMPIVTHQAKVALILGVKRAKVFSWVTSRHLEAVFSGAIAIYDASYDCMDGYLGKDFAVEDKAQALKKFKWISKLSNEDRYSLWRHQFEKVKNHNWNKYCYDFEQMCVRYGIAGAVSEKYCPLSPDKHYINISKILKRIKTSPKTQIPRREA